MDGRADLPVWMPILMRPCMMGLICSHGDLCVSGAIERSLIDVCRPHEHILIINYHPFCMNINHEPPVLLR